MIQIHLDITDKEYQAALAKKLLWHNGGGREICVHDFMDEAERRTCLVENRENCIWLISADNRRDLPQDTVVLMMTEVPTDNEEECFAYQPFCQIQKRLTEQLYAHGLIEKALEQEHKAECVYLYSPFGGIGVSSLALQLAERAAKSEKVLLFSLDAYHSFDTEFVAFRLSDFLFYWETLERVKVQDFCQSKGNLQILHGPRNPEDLAILKARKKEELLEVLTAGGYDRIIFDLSSSGMEFWCRPGEKREKFFVIKRMADKWKQFSATANFEYIAVAEENALAEIEKQMRSRSYVNEVLSANY